MKRVYTYDQVDNAVLKWFTNLRPENVSVCDVLIKEQS